MRYPSHIEQIIRQLRRFPGVGTRTAERFAFSLLQWDEAELKEFSDTVISVPQSLVPCIDCGCLLDEGICKLCTDSCRDRSVLCILSSPRDVYAIEQTGQFRGGYYIIKGLLSPLAGRSYQDVGLDQMKNRVEQWGVKEAVLVFDSSPDGDATALCIKELLQPMGVSVSRPAYGIPMGTSIEGIDQGTLACALMGRQQV